MSQDNRREPIEAREYAALLDRQKWTIAAIALAIAAASLVFSLLQDTVYTASARVLVTPFASTAALSNQVGFNVNTESQLISSGPVAEDAASSIGYEGSRDRLLDNLSAQPIVGTEVVTINYTSGDPEFAQAAANAFAQSYIEYRGELTVESIADAGALIEQRLEALQEQLEQNKEELSREERNSLVVQRGLLQQRLADLQPEGTASLLEGDVIEPAELPTDPSSPNHKRNVMIGALLGVILGIAAAFTRDYFRTPATSSS